MPYNTFTFLDMIDTTFVFSDKDLCDGSCTYLEVNVAGCKSWKIIDFSTYIENIFYLEVES